MPEILEVIGPFGITIIVLAFVRSEILRIVRKREIKEVKRGLREKAEREPEKVRPAWDLARVTLEEYFNKNLSQINYIFVISLIVMFFGFGVIAYGVVKVFQNPDSLSSGIVTSVAGIITEVIGATFLNIYRSTIQQAREYSVTLERINSVGMAMQILDTMPNNVEESDIKNQTKSKIVELLIARSHIENVGGTDTK